MKHNLSISVSKQNGREILSCKKVNLREKFMSFLFGDLKEVTILVQRTRGIHQRVCAGRWNRCFLKLTFQCR